jgi:hypothetical protein
MTIFIENQQLIDLLSVNFFYGNQNLSSTVLSYTSRGLLIFLIEKTIKNGHKNSNELSSYLLNQIQTIHDLCTYKVLHVEELRKVCVFTKKHAEVLREKDKLWDEYNIYQVTHYCLERINELHPLSKNDPIMLEKVSKEDSFTNLLGQRFSVSSLVHYHNTRDYRRSEGEQYGEKFIINPITNLFFSVTDSMDLIQIIVKDHPDKDLLDLCSTAMEPQREERQSENRSGWNSLRNYYENTKRVIEQFKKLGLI